jgi:hypothetical protein
LRGKQPKLKPNQAKHLLELHDSGNHTQAQLAGLFGVGRWATSRLGTQQSHAITERFWNQQVVIT